MKKILIGYLGIGATITAATYWAVKHYETGKIQTKTYIMLPLLWPVFIAGFIKDQMEDE